MKMKNGDVFCYYRIIVQFVFILQRTMWNELVWMVMITRGPNEPLNELINFGIHRLLIL